MALSGLFAATAALADPALTAPAGIQPAGTSNSQLALLDTQQVEFKWTRGSLGNGQVKDFSVFVGSLIGSSEISDSGPILAVDNQNDYATTVTVAANGGNRVFVRLSWTAIEGGVEVIKNTDYAIKAALSSAVDGNLHYVYDPVPGSALTLQDVDGCKAAPMVTFNWGLASALVTADGGAPDEWWFYVGTAADDDQYYNSGRITPEQRSVTVASIPTNGAAVQATLWWRRGTGAWASSVYTYATPTLPAITSPAPGGTLSGTSGNLALNPNGLPVQYWWVYAGPERQSVDYLSAGSEVVPTAPTTTLTPFQNFPDDGSDVYVTLFWRLQGETQFEWKCREYVYKASTGPTITTPAAAALLPTTLVDPADTTNTELVEWTDNGTNAVRWEVVLNTTGDPNDNGVWSSGNLGAAVRSANIPKARFTTDGSTVYIVLRYAVNGGLAQNLFDGSKVAAYETRKAPYLSAPGTVGKCFTSGLGNEVTFEWSDGNFPNVKGYWLYAGTAREDDSYLNTGALGVDVASRTIKNLPTDGSALWVRLWYLVGTSSASNADPGNGGTTTTTNTYQFRDFLFTNPTCPEITSPGFAAQIDGIDNPVTIDTHGVGVNGLWVTVSSVAPDGGSAKNPNPGVADIDSSGLLAAGTTNFTIRNLPVDGSSVYVTLWWLENSSTVNNWDFRTYAYVSSNAAPPSLTSPDPAAEFNTNAGQTFTWTKGDTVVFGWWLYVGKDVGLADRHNSGFLDAAVLSDAVPGLPFGNNYVRLWYLDQLTTWRFIDYVLDNKAGGTTGGGGTTGPTGPSNETDGNGDNNGSI